MKADIKAQWLAALRSGDYQQSTGYLNDGKGFCCLGVLCDLAVKAGVIGSRPSAGSSLVVYDGADSLPSDTVKDWAGLGSPDPVVTAFNGESRRLSVVNDEGAPFSAIADLIEEQL